MNKTIKKVLTMIGVVVILAAVAFLGVKVTNKINDRGNDLIELTSSLTLDEVKIDHMDSYEMVEITGESNMIMRNETLTNCTGVFTEGNEAMLVSAYYKNSVTSDSIRITTFNIEYFNYDTGLHSTLYLHGTDYIGTRTDYTSEELADLMESCTVDNYKQVLDYFDVAND